MRYYLEGPGWLSHAALDLGFLARAEMIPGKVVVPPHTGLTEGSTWTVRQSDSPSWRLKSPDGEPEGVPLSAQNQKTAPATSH